MTGIPPDSGEAAPDQFCLVHAVIGRDAEIIARVLVSGGFRAEICPSLAMVAARIGREVTALIIAEECLSSDGVELMIDRLAAQPSWSDLPVIVLTAGEKRTGGLRRWPFLARFGNVTMIDRPMHIGILLGAVRAAARVRARQHLLEDRERHLELLAREVNHRVRNTLAIVQAIARQTLIGARPEQMPERLDALWGRLAALAGAHDLLARHEWAEAPLDDVVRRAAAPAGDLVRIEGPACSVSAKVALGVSLVIYELGANAAKHGALSFPGGRVDVSWEKMADLELRLTWTETGGPAVISPPHRQGFGSKLISTVIERDLFGSCSRDWATTGLRFALSVGVYILV